MADLGNIGYRLPVAMIATGPGNEIFMADGTYQEYSTDAIGKVIAIDPYLQKIQSIAITNPAGEYEFDTLPCSPISLLGVDIERKLSPEHVAIYPTGLAFGNATETGWDELNTSSGLTISSLTTVTNNSEGNDLDIALTTIGHERGQYVIRFDIETLPGDAAVGLSTLNGSGDSLGEHIESIALWSNGDIIVGGTVVDSIFSFQSGDSIIVMLRDSKVWFARIRNGTLSESGSSYRNISPSHIFPTGYIWHGACTALTNLTEITIKTLNSTIYPEPSGFIGWDAIDNSYNMGE